MAELLPDQINKPNSIDFEMDLGFSIKTFLSSYRKRFHQSNYLKLKVVFSYTLEEYLAFEVFFTENLRYGVLPFLADFDLNLGVRDYELSLDPVVDNFESDLYTVSLELLQVGSEASATCSLSNACLVDFISNLQGSNTSLSNNVTCPNWKTEAGLCTLNLKNMILGDINEYSQQKILV